MKLGVLFSGGKDSVFAMYKAMQHDDVVCLINVISENKESYMFHTPNIELTRVQAEAIGLPLIIELTKGQKEEELEDLRRAIQRAKREYKLDGIVTGALASVYQASRIQKICNDLELKCINPLWQTNQIDHMRNVVDAGFEVMIVGVFARPLTHLLGKKINKHVIDELADLERKHKINPAGEGGEIETFVLDGPIFKKRIVITDVEIGKEVYSIKDAKLVEK
ncbi:MAG TPA: diphthine--ammonia ligase [archaeon]|nr:diphthine--ammonia ligase [archaeon]